MSVTTLVTLTVIEIVALVVVLAIYVPIITRGLRSISANLAKVVFGVRAVEEQVSNIGPYVGRANQTLSEVARALPGVASKAEALAAAQRRQS